MRGYVLIQTECWTGELSENPRLFVNLEAAKAAVPQAKWEEGRDGEWAWKAGPNAPTLTIYRLLAEDAGPAIPL